MRAYRCLSGLMICAVIAGCAQVQKDHVARSSVVTTNLTPPPGTPSSSPRLVVSGKLNHDLSSEYFGYFDITIENKSDQWLVISKVDVSFPDSFQNEHIDFISGARFAFWQRSMEKIIAVGQYNKHAAMATVAALGTGVVALSGNRNMQEIGAGVAVAARGAYLSNVYGMLLDSVQNTKRYPENHLLSDSIAIAPGLFVDRWLLANSRNHDSMEYVTNLIVELEFSDGTKERHELNFRPRRASAMPKWQREVFRRKGYLVQNQPSY